ncbi:MAG: RidA family protein [Acidimicrobiales bacterium]
MTRRSIHIDSFAHENPIPVATRIGPFVASGVIPGFDPGSRDMPQELSDQAANLFTHIGNALEAAGAGWDDMAKISFYANHPDARAVVNPFWEKYFPDPESRPSRHTHITDGGGRPRITCDFIAYVTG